MTIYFCTGERLHSFNSNVLHGFISSTDNTCMYADSSVLLPKQEMLLTVNSILVF